MYYVQLGEIKTFDCALNVRELKGIAAKGGYYSYIAGTAAVVLLHHSTSISKQKINPIQKSLNDDVIDENNFKGVYIKNYLNTLPMGKGLSSSAAVCVLVAKCFNHVSSFKDVPLCMLVLRSLVVRLVDC